MAAKLKKWDSAAHLKTEADIARYWEACLEEGRDDPAFITAALGNIARVRGMTGLARNTGLTREGLYKALSPGGSPKFGTVMRVIRALGLEFHGSAAKSERTVSLLSPGREPEESSSLVTGGCAAGRSSCIRLRKRTPGEPRVLGQ